MKYLRSSVFICGYIFLFFFSAFISPLSVSALEITNGAATAISASSAWIPAVSVATNGTTNVVTAALYYGITDGGTNTWSNTNSYGTVTNLATISNQVTSLSPATLYYYRWHIVEGTNAAWAADSSTFETLSQLAIANGAATAIAVASAWIPASVLSTNGSSSNVTASLFYGTTDGGTNTWSTTNSYGSVTNLGAISNQVTSLSPAKLYYYRWNITEGSNTAWATSATNFTTLSQLAVSAGSISNIAATSAKFYGTLTVTNGSTNAHVVTLYYGQVDYSNNAASWASSNTFTAASLTFSTNITALAGAQKYFCRWYATEGTNTAWSAATTNFWTLAGVPTGTPAVATFHAVMADTNGVIVSPTNDPMNLNNKSISNITALIGSANSARIDMTGVTPAIYDDSGIASIKFGSGMWGRNLCDFSGRNVLNWGYSAGSPISVFTNIYMDGGVVIGNLSGNANNSLNLGGIPAANFITAGTGPTFGSLILTNLPTSTNGLSVGAIYRSGSNLFIHGY